MDAGSLIVDAPISPPCMMYDSGAYTAWKQEEPQPDVEDVQRSLR